MRFFSRTKFLIAFLAMVAAGGVHLALAAAPAGADWFQLLTNQQTGSDNTGDGNTGNGSDLNYYYVGQTFTTPIQIRSTGPGATAANIWIDYPSTTTTASNLTTGSFFSTWSGQTVSSTVSPGVGRIFSTGANIPVTVSSGTGTFGNVDWTVNRPSSLARATSSPVTLDINIGTVGATTESNISNAGVDLLDSAEDFQVNFWADTIRPFAETSNVASGTTGVTIDTNYLFRLFDTRDGEGFSTSTANNAGGVGTGVNTATPPGTLTLTPTHFTPTSNDAYSCSGVWGTNVCNATIDPPSPLSISGDTRNWLYSQAYQLCIAGYQDLASASQNQLGETNGPNAMLTKCFDFTTEADTVAPQVVSETPTASSAGGSISTNITINVEDRKTYTTGPSGTGVATTTCAFDVWSTSQATTTYSLPSGLVTITATSYGKQYVINPATDFAQNERVWVRASACQDLAANVMTVDTWYFDTSDTAPPYVYGRIPDNDEIAATSTLIRFSVRDEGVGVDIANTFIFINGIYYSSGGGAGTVTLSGTSISFATSTDFTAFYTSTSTRQYNFSIGPLTFAEGEAIPIIIYSRDTGSTLMPRVVYSLIANGSGVCASGATFCGTNASWNGSSCVGTSTTTTTTSSSSCSVASGGGSSDAINQINDTTVSVAQIDGDSVLVTWLSNRPGTGRVLYGDRTSTNLASPENFGYQFSTQLVTDQSLYHSIVIDGLQAGTLYYFRPASEMNGREVLGREVLMSPVFATQIVREDGTPIPTDLICPVQLPAGTTSPQNPPATTSPAPLTPIGQIPSIPTVDVASPTPDIPTAPTSPVSPTSPTPSLSATIIDRTRTVAPIGLAGVIGALLATVALMAGNMVRLGRIADRNGKPGRLPERHQQHMRNALFIAGGGIAVAFTAALVAMLGTSPWQDSWRNVLSSSDSVIIQNVSGVVYDLSGAPVKGVALTAGNTLITTGESGMYSFSNIPKEQGIRIVHPDLSMAVQQSIRGEGKMDIRFELGALQSVSDIARFEAAGDTRNLYKQIFIESLKPDYTQDQFIGDYRTHFTTADLRGKALKIISITRLESYQSKLSRVQFQGVIRVEVQTSTGVADYLLTNEQGKWKLVF